MIARTPKVKNSKAEAFIRGPKPAAGNGSSARGKRIYTRVITNINQDLLERIDTAATGMGLNRSAFIIAAVAERLRALGS